MNIKKEFLTEIKTEPIDYPFEYSEYTGEIVVGVVEVGQEFKTEPTYSSEAPSTDHSKISADHHFYSRQNENNHCKHKSHAEDQLIICKNRGKNYHRSHLGGNSTISGQSLSSKHKVGSKRFPCDHCEYKTDVKTNLSTHIQAKHLPRDPNLNKCKKCGKSYSQRSYLLQHLKLCGQSKDLKNSLTRFNCDHCKYKTDVKSYLSTHMQAKHLPRDPNSNKCKKCAKIFSWRSTLLQHLKLCGQSKNLKDSLVRFDCDHCEYKTLYKSNLSTHMQVKHLPRDPNLNKCKKCGKSFLWRSTLRQHLKLCGQSEDLKRSLKRFPCDRCEYKTDHKPNLSRHMQAKHLPRDPDSNKCNKCQKIFLWRSTLLQHLKVCGQSKDMKNSFMHFNCDHCEYKTDHKTSLSRHMQAKHLPRNPNSNKCKKCGKSFAWRSNLLHHSKFCGQSEGVKNALMRLNCDHCEYKTNYKSSINTHMQAKHLPRDPNLNKCEKCGKSYSRRSTLLKHLRLCGQSKNLKNLSMRFNCDHCKYKTHLKSRLSIHMQAKHLPRDPNLNKCKKCGKSYCNRSYLMKHSCSTPLNDRKRLSGLRRGSIGGRISKR